MKILFLKLQNKLKANLRIALNISRECSCHFVYSYKKIPFYN